MDTLIKQPAESILYDIEMKWLGRLSSGDAITSVSSVTAEPNDLTISDISHDFASIVQFRASGGTDGTTYKVTATVLTAGGDTLQGEGQIKVMEL
jgi:hypothetical protein